MKLVLQPGRAAQLICPAPECPHKPRVAWAAMANQASETVAAGRRHTYI